MAKNKWMGKRWRLMNCMRLYIPKIYHYCLELLIIVTRLDELLLQSPVDSLIGHYPAGGSLAGFLQFLQNRNSGMLYGIIWSFLLRANYWFAFDANTLRTVNRWRVLSLRFRSGWQSRPLRDRVSCALQSERSHCSCARFLGRFWSDCAFAGNMRTSVPFLICKSWRYVGQSRMLQGCWLVWETSRDLYIYKTFLTVISSGQRKLLTWSTCL